MNYWEECIRIAFDEAGIVATDEQVNSVVGDVEGGHENYGMAFGHDCIPNPMISEVEALKQHIKKLEDEHETVLSGVRSGVAKRRNVSVSDVHIDETGHVTYDRR